MREDSAMGAGVMAVPSRALSASGDNDRSHVRQVSGDDAMQ
jgi:hypothetical protein